MSNIKNLLGDTTLEELGEKCKVVLNRLKDSDLMKSMEICLYSSDGLYDCWLEIQGRELAIKWVIDHGPFETGDKADEYIQYLVDGFKEWLEKHI